MEWFFWDNVVKSAQGNAVSLLNKLILSILTLWSQKKDIFMLPFITVFNLHNYYNPYAEQLHDIHTAGAYLGALAPHFQPKYL